MRAMPDSIIIVFVFGWETGDDVTPADSPQQCYEQYDKQYGNHDWIEWIEWSERRAEEGV